MVYSKYSNWLVASAEVGSFEATLRNCYNTPIMLQLDLDRFVFVAKLGEGAYGSVFKVVNQETGQVLAVKRTPMDEEGVPSTTLRELSILKYLDHPNIIKLLSWRVETRLVPASLDMVFEHMREDLHSRIDRYKPRGMPAELVKHIMWQILQALNHMHNKRVYHRDLKPQNVLISEEDVVKVADFGLGRVVGLTRDTFSKEIETLWYRAPELLLGQCNYCGGVDVWSAGCIFYQLFEGKVLFGESCEFGQIMEIFNRLGTPKRSEWQEVLSLPHFKVTFPKMESQGLDLNRFCAQGKQLLMKMLVLNPARRIKVHEALADPYFDSIRNPQ